ncbi:molybdate ABC transporter permease subunit [Massilia sp. TS11]|uniref:molybdate ABC transporter permease subunit n=1 Tax=Massilia sp. TS11 TaxID=2908003 RepID=UPI001EDA4BF0|nr:molybdate ABC transporter permease subunit [Massilia sp. TS11]MCG2586024.1 molybdate ABC transporter permease subunit [Massilia sp. TS11]
MFSPDDLAALWLTLRLATATTVLLLIVAAPLAWWLARSRSLAAGVVGALTTLPMVLPPTVIGFYLLVLMGEQGPLGRLTSALGWGLLPFSFSGLLLASLIYSLPFAVQPIQQAFKEIGPRPLEVAATLGAGPVDRFFSVALPLARHGIVTAAVMSFAHTVGEFGVVLMIGGNIPGATRLISVQIFDHVEALEYQQAHWLSGGMLAFSFVVLLSLHFLQRRRGER